MTAKVSGRLKLPPRDKHVNVVVKSSAPLVSADELHMLLVPSLKFDKASAPEIGFKYRNIFLLFCTFWLSVWLIFFPDAGYQFLTLPPNIEAYSSYLQKRGWLYLFLMLVYGWSYARAWYFERISLICFAAEMTMFGMDCIALFGFISGPMSPVLTTFMLLRVLFIACLLTNALYAHQAPLPPRSL